MLEELQGRKLMKVLIPALAPRDNSFSSFGYFATKRRGVFGIAALIFPDTIRAVINSRQTN